METHYDRCYKKIVREVNACARKKRGLSLKKKDFEQALVTQNTTIENKKKRLISCLHKLIITTFSIKLKHINKKTLEQIKSRTALAREIVQKIKSINNYIEESLLHELGIIKRSLVLEALKNEKPEKYLEKKRSELSKPDMKALELAVYRLMQDIVLFDDRLLTQYKKKDLSTKRTEKLELKDLQGTLKKQTEYLDALEAKIPPASKMTMRLFRKDNFEKWVPLLFALLANIEAEQKKEAVIFTKIKKNAQLRKKIESKIKHIVEEKKKVLQLKEKRALEMDSFEKVQNDFRRSFHEYVAASHL